MDSEIVPCEIDEATLINNTGARRMSYDELSLATNSFSEVLEESYGGVVYKAQSQHQNIVAVKKLKSRFPEQMKKNFIAEINSSGTLRHRNLVQLIGWCEEGGELFLAYDEFMPSLDERLFGHSLSQPLSWENRYNIACGLASGINYLHRGSQKCVIHRDIKPASVMLGHGLIPKLGNFWLARSTDHGNTMRATLAWGTYDYMAPEVYFTGAKASKESDVYSFGIVALELATGRRPRIVGQARSTAMPLVSSVWDLYDQGSILKAVDHTLQLQTDQFIDERDQAERLLVVGLWCCNTIPSDRPQMNRVLAVLEGFTRLSDVPLKSMDAYYKDALRPTCIEHDRQDNIDEATLNRSRPSHNDVDDGIGLEIHEATRISYDVLHQATNYFNKNMILGKGAYGVVYRAELPNHYNKTVAVKRLITQFDEQSHQDFLAEINCTRNLKHLNLVHLIDWCSHDKSGEILLVLEFMENRSLDMHLFNNKFSTLSWEKRYNIALGLASGIDHLHEGSQQCVIHRDIKPANVMLDIDWTPKLGDFGLAKLTDHGKSMNTTGTCGTHGYMAPEIKKGEKPSIKWDVYSFGIVALEIATGRTPRGEQPIEMPLLSWVSILHAKGKDHILEAIDRKLDTQFDESQARRLLVVALWCCNTRPSKRPLMKQVIAVLNGDIRLHDASLKVKPQKGYFEALALMSPSSNRSGQGTSSTSDTEA